MIKLLLKNSLLIASLALNNFASADTPANPTPNTESQPGVAANLQHYLESIEQFRSLPIDGRLARDTATYYYNTDKTKIQALYGVWQVLVQTSPTRPGSLEVDASFEDKNFGYYGWDSKHSISCFYEPNMFNSSYAYQCLHVTDATNGIAQRYIFNLNGNTLNGKYHSGTTTDFLAALKVNDASRLFNISGIKNTDPYFEDKTGELILPKVSAYGKNYSVILKRENNGLFSLKTANPL